jgi:hypothetical protein
VGCARVAFLTVNIKEERDILLTPDLEQHLQNPKKLLVHANYIQRHHPDDVPTKKNTK